MGRGCLDFEREGHVCWVAVADGETGGGWHADDDGLTSSTSRSCVC